MLKKRGVRERGRVTVRSVGEEACRRLGVGLLTFAAIVPQIAAQTIQTLGPCVALLTITIS